jgi:hypothetical protein
MKNSIGKPYEGIENHEHLMIFIYANKTSRTV